MSTLISCPGHFFSGFYCCLSAEVKFSAILAFIFSGSRACLAVLCRKFPGEAKILWQTVHVRWYMSTGLDLILLEFSFEVCGSMLLLFLICS